MMNPNILNKNPLMFFDRAVNAQRSQLLTVMADAVQLGILREVVHERQNCGAIEQQALALTGVGHIR